MKHVYDEHLWDQPKVSARDRCPVYRGCDQIPVKISAKPNITQSGISIVILGGVKDSFLLTKTSAVKISLLSLILIWKDGISIHTLVGTMHT